MQKSIRNWPWCLLNERKDKDFAKKIDIQDRTSRWKISFSPSERETNLRNSINHEETTWIVSGLKFIDSSKESEFQDKKDEGDGRWDKHVSG